MARSPSHFSSYAQVSSSAGNRAAGAGVIGRTRSGIGVQPGSGGSIRWIIQSLPLVWNSTYRPDTRLPCRTTMTSLSRHLLVTVVPRSEVGMRPPPLLVFGNTPEESAHSQGRPLAFYVIR